MTSLKHCENLLRCQPLTSRVRSVVNHSLGSSIWTCVRSINIPKLRLTHWINPLQLSTLSLWMYMCNKNNKKNYSQQEEDRPPRQEKERAKNRRGRNKRKSYAIEFKKQTLDLLDNLSNSRNKWQKVADAKKVSSSLVVKWNKARSSILSKIVKNKQKTNAGGAREARRRRQTVGEKARNSEKYPLAFKLLITEFKLRRAKGSKITKLWLTTKMKQKIESCYGKEEASKFKARNNRFQRFKPRYNISLRRRTNKKKNAANGGRETIQKFHRELSKAVQSKRRSERPVVDNTYGRWSPQNRLNV